MSGLGKNCVNKSCLFQGNAIAAVKYGHVALLF